MLFVFPLEKERKRSLSFFENRHQASYPQKSREQLQGFLTRGKNLTTGGSWKPLGEWGASGLCERISAQENCRMKGFQRVRAKGFQRG
jgi:hypothetical protein